jgi:hypothetical protein
MGGNVEFINATRMVAGYTMGTEPSGRENLIVVIKGTFRIPADGEDLRLSDVQAPLVMADTFTGAPGLSSPVYESDFALRKARCDVLLLGSAYAPGGCPATRVPVGLRVGAMVKKFAVIGARRWETGATGIGATPPEPFVIKPISYDVAFGGVDQEHEDPMKHAAFMPNPVGCGYRKHLRGEWVDGKPLPSTEELDRPVTRPDEPYRPMALGPIGRNWEPRYRFAGTYDDNWLDQHFPFLPPDFDEKYFQAAAGDQQLAGFDGPTEVNLVNLTPGGQCAFTLPYFEAPIHVFPRKGEREDHFAKLDTVVFEPDLARCTMTWRLARPLRKNIFEIAQVLIGRKGSAWWQQREAVAFPIPVVLVQSEPEPATSEE